MTDKEPEQKFKSDFLLKPLNCKTKSGLATWHADTDPAIHDLMDGYRTDHVTYTCVRHFDGKYKDCKVIREKRRMSPEYDIILSPGDGTRYSVTKISSNNRVNDKVAEDNTYACVICQEYTKNHVSIPCGHLVSCTRCTKKMEDDRCPLCRVPYTQLLRIFQ
jgi:hypothetical protein